MIKARWGYSKRDSVYTVVFNSSNLNTTFLEKEYFSCAGRLFLSVIFFFHSLETLKHIYSGICNMPLSFPASLQSIFHLILHLHLVLLAWKYVLQKKLKFPTTRFTMRSLADIGSETSYLQFLFLLFFCFVVSEIKLWLIFSSTARIKCKFPLTSSSSTSQCWYPEEAQKRMVAMIV